MGGGAAGAEIADERKPVLDLLEDGDFDPTEQKSGAEGLFGVQTHRMMNFTGMVNCAVAGLPFSSAG